MRIISIVFAVVLLSVSQLALAQESSPLSRLSNLQQGTKSQVQLDELKVEQIKQGCAGAQQILKKVSTQINSSTNKRRLLYGDIQKESKAMEIRLTRQGVDASELDLLIGKNQQTIEDMVSANNRFKSITDDVVAINCQENPGLFYFGLTLLRADLQLLESYDLTIYDLIKNANNVTFKPLANRLTL